MQISSQTVENTCPTCNYVNCLWLFIQLFTLVFAHAFICYIRGWQWCPENGRLSPQALWTDNRQGENPPLQSCAASWPAYGTQRHMESDCFEEACTALLTIHDKERTRVPAHEYTPLTSRTRVRYSSTFLVSCWKSHTGMLLLCYECSLMFRIFSGNKWHSESKVSSNLCCLARREIRFWQAILDNEESNLHEKHWCGERWRKDMQLQSRSKQSLIVERFCFLHEEQVNS